MYFWCVCGRRWVLHPLHHLDWSLFSFLTLIIYSLSLKSVLLWKSLSRVWLFVTPWTAACQALLSMGFPKQEYWSELPFPSLGDLPNPGFEPMSPTLAGGFFTTEPPGKSRKAGSSACITLIWGHWLDSWKHRAAQGKAKGTSHRCADQIYSHTAR